MNCVACVEEEGEGWKGGRKSGGHASKKKSDQQYIVHQQEHSWKVWIDVMRLCYEMCHVLQWYVMCLYVLVCYCMLSYVIVTYGLSVPRPRL